MIDTLEDQTKEDWIMEPTPEYNPNNPVMTRSQQQ